MYGTQTTGTSWELTSFGIGSVGRSGTAVDGSTRTERERAQRHRILQAVLSIASIGGYGTLSAALILRTADVPRRAFNTWFSTAEDAFVASHARCIEQLGAAVRAGIDPDGDPMQRLRQGLEAAVEHLIADPARAYVIVVEAHVAGGEALRQNESAIEAIVAEVHELLVQAGVADPAAERIARTGVGALRETFRARIARGELHVLPAVAGTLVEAAFPLRLIGHTAGRVAERPISVLAA